MASFRRQACPSLEPIAQVTLLALLDNNSTVYTMLAQLGLENWRIMAFDPSTREVCVELLAKSGVRLIDITLSPITVSGIKD